MNYTLHGHLIAILVSGSIILTINSLVRSLTRKDSGQSGFVKVLKLIFLTILSIPVALSPILYLVFPSLSIYYFVQFLVGLVFAVSFLIFEFTATKVPSIDLMVDRLASKLIEAFVSLNASVYRTVISKHFPRIRSQFISMLIRHDVSNKCIDLVTEEFEYLDLATQAKAVKYSYVASIPVPEEDDDWKYFEALNVESLHHQERQKRLSEADFLAMLFTSLQLRDHEITRV